jgi:hypothetical protein
MPAGRQVLEMDLSQLPDQALPREHPFDVVPGWQRVPCHPEIRSASCTSQVGGQPAAPIEAAGELLKSCSSAAKGRLPCDQAFDLVPVGVGLPLWAL